MERLYSLHVMMSNALCMLSGPGSSGPDPWNRPAGFPGKADFLLIRRTGSGIIPDTGSPGKQEGTEMNKEWIRSRDQLAAAAASLGYPEELADLLARQLGSPRAIDRMTAYLYHAHPGSLEMIADEMLAIRAEIDAWRERKESREAQEGYSAWLNSEAREPDGE